MTGPRQLTTTSDTLRPTFQNVMQCPAIAADRRAVPFGSCPVGGATVPFIRAALAKKKKKGSPISYACAAPKNVYASENRSDVSLSLAPLIEIPFYILSLSASNFDTAIHIELRVTLIRRCTV